jgi:preprotein translocase SecE subunit
MARTPRRRVSTGAAAEAAAPPQAPRRIRDNLPRPAAPAPAPRPLPHATPQPTRRRNPVSALSRLQPRFVADIVAETRKVTWPTFAETRYLTFVVVVVAVVVGLFLGLIDLGFGWVVERLFF